MKRTRRRMKLAAVAAMAFCPASRSLAYYSGTLERFKE